MTKFQRGGIAVAADADAGGERTWVVFKQIGLVAALILLPLFYALVPPLEDYPNHLARMYALASLPGNEALSRFYEAAWAPVPNLIMDLIVPPLTPFLGVYAAGRVFVGLTLLLMLLGPVVLQRVLNGRWSAWPLVGGLFVYNGFLFTGLMNYLFGVGVAVFGLAAWMALSERQWLVRALVSVAFCAVLYVCHLSALGLYGLSIGSFEFWRLWTQKGWRPMPLLKSALALGVPFLPFVYLLVTSPTWGLSHDIVWESQGKFEAITLFFSVYSDFTDIPFLVLIAAAIGIAIRRGLVRFHPAGVIVAGILTIAFLAMPRMAFGSWMADQRLVVGIFFMSLGFISVDLKRLENHNAFFAICLVAIAFRIVDVSAHWVAISQPLLELRTSLRTMQPGSRLLVTQADDPAEGAVDAALSHAPNLAVIERSALVSRLFVVPGKQILRARAGHAEHVDTEDGDTPTISRVIVDADEKGPSADGPHYWDRWPDFYDYLIVLGTDPDETANPAPDLLQIMHNGRGFQLYKVRKPS
ncbi:hypothetical protein [Microvirga sp. M2]|uniref:hypothetical protein n=1 Tax=Microvirga sp. M2 TaxID=3073270 RepID=UPI0039C14103